MEDHVSWDRRKASEELMRGHEFAKQLREVVINTGDDNDNDDESTTVFAQDLVSNVLKSFTNTLFLFNKYPSYQSHDVSHIQQLRDSCLIGPSKSEDSQEIPKSSAIKNRRGCYKRRRTAETTEEVSKTPTIDNHQWRKYGQKPILNAKYPRNYYRCSHKLDQGCQARKYVQRVQENPPLYKTIYCGHHTCNDHLNPETILDPSSPSDSSVFLISFDNTFPTPTKQECPFLSSSSFPSPPSMTKRECNKEEIIPSSSFDDYLLSPVPTLDTSSMHVTQSSTLEFDQSCWDVMSGSVENNDLFQFQPFVG